MKLNKQFTQIGQSATVAMADRVAILKANGRKIIPLQVGDPDFSTPVTVVDAAMGALQDGLTHYAPSRGLSELRLAIASKLAKECGNAAVDNYPFDPEREILVTHGGVHAYYLAVQSILNPGDEVLIPDPCWPTHVNMVKLLRGTVVHVPAPPENNFIPSITAWKKALTKKTRAVVINYPANPTGMYPDYAYLDQLIDFCIENDLWIISDEVYENIYFEKKPQTVLAFPAAKDRMILVNSLSKTYAMTGWRVGYLVAPEPVIDNALKAGQNSITCVAPFVQTAAAFALCDENVQSASLEMRAAYARRRDIVLHIFKEHRSPLIHVKPPMGTFYFFLDFRSLRLSSLEICERILDEVGVGLIPGSAFGEQGEGFIRMTIAASDEDVADGTHAILDWADALGRKK